MPEFDDFDEFDQAYLMECQAEKFEFDNEVVFQYNYKNDDSAIEESLFD